MSDRAFPCVPAATAAEVCQRFRLGRAAATLLREDLTPGQFLDLLAGRQLFEDAIGFLAHALPNREAVWWAVLCIRDDAGSAPPEPVVAALRTAEAWVRDPSDENRRAARGAARAAGLGSPAAMVATAAFLGGGSLGPPGGPEVLPSEYSAARSVANAVSLAALRDPPGKAPERFPSFVARGVEVATGASLWTEPAATDPQPGDAMEGTEPQAATNGASARTDPATPSKRAPRWQWQVDEATTRTEPRTATDGASTGTVPVTPSKRAARWEWD
jgi:hypothetical protein